MIERVEQAPRTSLAGRSRAAGPRVSLLALSLVACSTYDASLIASYDAATAAGGSPGGGGASAAAGGANSAGAPGAAGTLEDAGAAGVDVGDGGSDAGAGMGSVAGAGGNAGVAGATSNGGTTAGGAAGSSGGSAGAPNNALIDDFEDMDGFILHLQGRNGPWYVFNDMTAGVESPFTVAPVTGTNAAPGSLWALHFTASGYSGAFGAGVGADFVNQATKKVAYDVSAYSGIRLYAKVGSGAQTTLKLLVPTTYSDPDGGKCSGTGSKQCNDHLYCTIRSLKTTWAIYQCNFADLTQQGFGLVQAGLDPATVYSMQFSLATNLVPVDIWIDDISFVPK